jgi:ATP-dependent helicase/nuclease subunit A
MSDIEIISASAGSGKTYRLAEILERAVRDKTARPEAVIATTFTRKAAAELRERVRQRLLEAGMAEEAQRLNAAVMGTVNSVCGRLVTDYAFDLGQSPELRILDEDMAAEALKRALFGVINEEMSADAARLKESFFEWKPNELVSRIVELARSNGLGEDDLAVSRDRCRAELKKMLGPPFKDGAGMEKKLIEAIQAFLAHVATGVDSTKTTQTAAESAKQFLDDLKAGKSLRWQDWGGMAKLGAAKKSAELAASIASLARDHVRLPRFHEDIDAAIRTVFNLACGALKSYREYKEERGIIDFVDQECLALRLLEKPEVRARLEGAFDLVLVDEFQDTSPIQLAIFLRLAEIAKRSIWVGDQKQSIFGFRGSDPELMNSVIERILGANEPETLPKSWRSRPALVSLTSELFARVFPRHGIPANRVRLEAARKEGPEDLGPVVERWYLTADGRSKSAKADALAAGIKQCLEDSSVKIQEKGTDKVRPVEPRDIAVLCRMNNTCTAIAESLGAIGIKCAVARGGLMGTPEAKLVLAGVQLWSDPGDSLSAAEIARILEHPDDPDRWLGDLLKNPGMAAFKDVPAVHKIREISAEERSRLGVLASFDRIMEILAIRDLCRQWGDASERLSGLNVLRSYAVKYLDLMAEEGAGMTTAGLSTYLAGLDDGTSDAKAFSPDADAVVITTWHRAKGLEWPIVALYELDFDFKRIVPDVHVDTDRPRIDLDDPLAGRWIRYWPNPYFFRTKSVYHEPMAEHAAVLKRAEIEKRESLRLLYVGWTRARDRVVLTSARGKLDAGILEEFREDGAGDERGAALLSEPIEGKAIWGGIKLGVEVREAAAVEENPLKLSAEATYVTKGPTEHPDAYSWPDLSAGKWMAGDPEIIGKAIVLKAPVEPLDMGSAVHGFIAADKPEYSREARLELAAEVLKLWGIGSALTAGDLVEISDRLRRWTDSKWPGAKWYREWPVFQRFETGSVMRGVADLMLETPAGVVVIDHKAYPGSPAEAREYALGDAPQVQVYADTAAKATGKPILGMYIHFPLIGALVALKRE